MMKHFEIRFLLAFSYVYHPFLDSVKCADRKYYQESNQQELEHALKQPQKSHPNSSKSVSAQQFFPKLPKFIVIYQILSTANNIYIIIRSLIVLSASKSDSILPCFLPGRVVTFYQFEDITLVVSAFVASFHLAWRILMLLEEFRFDCVFFLLCVPDSVVQSRIDSKQEQRDYTNELLFSRMVRNGKTINYFLRPTRTMKFREKLRDRLRLQLRAAVIFVTTVFFIMVPFSFTQIISDRGIVANYPGCYPELEEKVEKTKHISLLALPEHISYLMQFKPRFLVSVKETINDNSPTLFI